MRKIIRSRSLLTRDVSSESGDRVYIQVNSSSPVDDLQIWVSYKHSSPNK